MKKVTFEIDQDVAEFLQLIPRGLRKIMVNQALRKLQEWDELKFILKKKGEDDARR